MRNFTSSFSKRIQASNLAQEGPSVETLNLLKVLARVYEPDDASALWRKGQCLA